MTNEEIDSITPDELIKSFERRFRVCVFGYINNNGICNSAVSFKKLHSMEAIGLAVTLSHMAVEETKKAAKSWKSGSE